MLNGMKGTTAMVNSATTWTVTTAERSRSGSAAAEEVGGQVRTAVLELVPQVSGPDVALLVQVQTEQGRLYPGLDGAGLPDPAATGAACDFLVGELRAADPD
jgi:hypothetical protein